jgi:hypothetical protein
MGRCCCRPAAANCSMARLERLTIQVASDVQAEIESAKGVGREIASAARNSADISHTYAQARKSKSAGRRRSKLNAEKIAKFSFVDARVRLASEGGRMSALLPIADIGTKPRNVRYVPKADILTGIASPARPHEIRGPPRREVARRTGYGLCQRSRASVLHAPLDSRRFRQIHVGHRVRRVLQIRYLIVGRSTRHTLDAWEVNDRLVELNDHGLEKPDSPAVIHPGISSRRGRRRARRLCTVEDHVVFLVRVHGQVINCTEASQIKGRAKPCS